VKVTVEQASNSEAILNVELEWSELEKASDRAYHKLAQRYNVPGFRPGHAPRSMLERMLGKDAIYQEGLETLIEDSYREAIRTHNLKPIGQPEVDAAPIQMNQPYTFTARVPVLAPVTLGDYQSVRVEHPRVDVTDEDVEKVVHDLQEQQALWVPAERPAQIGDRITADLKLTVGDRTISDLHDNEFELVESREGIFSGMDQHIAGMSEGETKEFTTTIPADYTNTDLAGQEAHYTVTLKAVKYRELPEIDDELAKSAGDYQTLDALKQSIREQLATRRESNAERDFREALIKAIVNQAQVEIHPILVADETGVMVREMQRLLEQSGLSWEQFLESSSKSEDEYRKELEPEARERVKRELVLDAIADAEGIAASDQEVQSYLDMLNAVGGGRPLRMRQLTAGQRQHLVNTVRRDRVTSQLVAAAEAEAVTAEEGAAPRIRAVGDEEASIAAATEAARAGAALAEEAGAGAAEAEAGSEAGPSVASAGEAAEATEARTRMNSDITTNGKAMGQGEITTAAETTAEKGSPPVSEESAGAAPESGATTASESGA
jgi:trigger factor